MGSSLSSISTWILSLKVVLIAAGVAAVAMAVESAVPLLLNFAVYDLPEICSVLHSCLKPPYLYLLINVIIITIAATSRFHRLNNHDNQYRPLVDPTASNLLEMPFQPNFGILAPPMVVYESVPRVFEEPQPPVFDVETVPMNDLEVVGVEDEEEFVISTPTWNPPQQIKNSPPPPENTPSEFISPMTEKPLVTSRFAHQKPMKTSPDGVRALRVAKRKKHETLESTWKTITDGRRMPLTRHLRKSDTFENHRHSEAYRREQAEATAGNKKKVVKKSETLKDRTNYDNQNHRPPPSTSSSPASGGKMRKDVSLGQDELNRRVEAFIKKFNDEMRLQRQESLKQYKEITNSGSR